MSKLTKLLLYVNHNNSFYQSLNNRKADVISNYPVIDRYTIQKNRYQMFSNGYKEAFYMKSLMSQSSSGTLGCPITVFWDKNQWLTSNINLWRLRKKWYGIHVNDKYVAFESNNNVENRNDQHIQTRLESNKLIVDNSSLRSKKSYLELIEIILEFKPQWMYIQPYILSRLIDGIKEIEEQNDFAIKYIEVVGEYLPSGLRHMAEKMFQANIASMYGSEEMNAIAFECPYHKMHVLDDNVFVEVLANQLLTTRGKGIAVITNLNNYAMPIIRYNQGDEIELDECHDCPCGLNGTMIESIHGRVNTCFMWDEQIIDSKLLSEIMDEVNNSLGNPIRQYHFAFHKTSKRLSIQIALQCEYHSWFETISQLIGDQLLQFNSNGQNLVVEYEKVEAEWLSIKKTSILEIDDE